MRHHAGKIAVKVPLPEQPNNFVSSLNQFLNPSSTMSITTLPKTQIILISDSSSEDESKQTPEKDQLPPKLTHLEALRKNILRSKAHQHHEELKEESDSSELGYDYCPNRDRRSKTRSLCRLLLGTCLSLAVILASYHLATRTSPKYTTVNERYWLVETVYHPPDSPDSLVAMYVAANPFNKLALAMPEHKDYVECVYEYWPSCLRTRLFDYGVSLVELELLLLEQFCCSGAVLFEFREAYALSIVLLALAKKVFARENGRTITGTIVVYVGYESSRKHLLELEALRLSLARNDCLAMVEFVSAYDEQAQLPSQWLDYFDCIICGEKFFIYSMPVDDSWTHARVVLVLPEGISDEVIGRVRNTTDTTTIGRSFYLEESRSYQLQNVYEPNLSILFNQFLVLQLSHRTDLNQTT